MARERAYLKCDEETRSFVKVLDGIDQSRSTYELFNDFTTISSCVISNTVDKINFNMREAEFGRVKKRYNEKQMEGFVELFAMMTAAIGRDSNRDFLGDLYSGLDLLDKRHQQFFTPYPISKFMAASISADQVERVRENGYIKVCDPSCGSGTMLIAYVNLMRKQNMNPARDALLVAQDIDMRVAKMCYISLSLMGCAAIVKVGNTLSLEDVPLVCTFGTPAFFGEDVWVERGLLSRAASTDKKAA